VLSNPASWQRQACARYWVESDTSAIHCRSVTFKFQVLLLGPVPPWRRTHCISPKRRAHSRTNQNNWICKTGFVCRICACVTNTWTQIVPWVNPAAKSHPSYVSCIFARCFVLQQVSPKHQVCLFMLCKTQDRNKYWPQLSSFKFTEVACWPFVPKFAGSQPAEAVGFLGRKNCAAHLPSERK
jgi:hypothetical protein